MQVDGWVLRVTSGTGLGCHGPWSLGPWMQRVDRHGLHLRICQCQGGVGSQSGPSQDPPCPAWLPQEGALLLISQAPVAQEGLHAQEHSHRPLCPCLHLPPAGYQDSGLSCSRSRKTDLKAALHLLGTSSLRFECLGVFIPSSILKMFSCKELLVPVSYCNTFIMLGHQVLLAYF